MTRSMQRVAEAVAGDPAGCAALTVTGLAELHRHQRGHRRPHRPAARLPRLPRPAPRARRRSPPSSSPGRAPAVTADIAVDDPIADVVAKLAYDEQQTLADTAAGLDTVQLGAAVAALATARRIDIYGVGASGLVAQDLAQKLLRIGLMAHAHSDPHLAVTNAVQLRAGDVAIAITHSGVDAATSSSRCASPSSAAPRPSRSPAGRTAPVTQYADHVLTTSTARESELRPAAMSPDQPAPRRGLPVHRRGAADVRDGGARARRLVRGPGPPPHPAHPADLAADRGRTPGRPPPDRTPTPNPDAEPPSTTAKSRTP